jgi:hypothetical protein
MELIVTTGAARLMDTNKRWVTLASGCLLILVPWMQVSRAAMSNIAVAPSSIAWVRALSEWIPLRIPYGTGCARRACSCAYVRPGRCPLCCNSLGLCKSAASSRR